MEKTALTIKTGGKFTYKLSKGRGRPFAGEVIKNLGAIGVEIKNLRTGEVNRIKRDQIISPYEFKKYNTKRRAAMAQTISDAMAGDLLKVAAAA